MPLEGDSSCQPIGGTAFDLKDLLACDLPRIHRSLHVVVWENRLISRPFWNLTVAAQPPAQRTADPRFVTAKAHVVKYL